MNVKEIMIFVLGFIAWAIVSTMDFNSLVACGYYVIN